MKDEVAWRNVKCSLGVRTDLWIYGERMLTAKYFRIIKESN